VLATNEDRSSSLEKYQGSILVCEIRQLKAILGHEGQKANLLNMKRKTSNSYVYTHLCRTQKEATMCTFLLAYNQISYTHGLTFQGNLKQQHCSSMT